MGTVYTCQCSCKCTRVNPPTLIKYLDLIHRAFREFSRTAWSNLHEHFRLRSAHDPSLDWRLPQWELWMQIMIAAKPLPGNRADSGPII